MKGSMKNDLSHTFNILSKSFLKFESTLSALNQHVLLDSYDLLQSVFIFEKENVD